MSHAGPDSPGLQEQVDEISRRLRAAGDTELGPLAEKEDILRQLQEFEFGRFLIINRGFNGRWIHSALYEYPLRTSADPALHPMEERLLQSWWLSSGRQRLANIKNVLEEELRPGFSLLSIPCGVMAEVLTLDPERLRACEVVGADYDPESLELASRFAQEKVPGAKIQFLQKDAWNLGYTERFDLVLSVGLSIYSPTEEVALDLYRSLFKAVKVGGKLIVSFHSPPAGHPESELILTSVGKEEMRFSRLVFSEILQLKLTHHNSTAQIKRRLGSVGFGEIRCTYNEYRSTNLAIATKLKP